MQLVSIIESILFVNEKPLKAEEIAEGLDIEKEKVIASIKKLKKKYEEENSGLCILEVAEGFQMCTNPKNEEWIKKLYREKFKRKLSSATLEVLAVIAYRQPVTRLEIESIRGVNCEAIIKNLLDMGLIKIRGRKPVIGRPFLYGTTRKFLEYFGLNSLEDLPKLQEEFSLEGLRNTQQPLNKGAQEEKE